LPVRTIHRSYETLRFVNVGKRSEEREGRFISIVVPHLSPKEKSQAMIDSIGSDSETASQPVSNAYESGPRSKWRYRGISNAGLVSVCGNC
jgi:hypothetical protein